MQRTIACQAHAGYVGVVAERSCYALLCSYDGGAFSGFQRQAPLLTIQGALEDAFASLGIKARIEGGGRTDAGVHARRQVVTLRPRLNSPLDTETLPLKLARHLPEGLTVQEARRAPTSFHARFSATTKIYRYRVAAAPSPTDWEQRFSWVLPDPRGFADLEGPVESLDEDAMRAILSSLTGWHDFKLLAHPGAEGKSRRLLARAELEVHPRQSGGNLYEFTFTAPGFIRHQIRNMIGVLVTAGLGRLEPGAIEALLSGTGERWLGVRAPGRGLTLWDILYQRGQDPFRPQGLAAASEALSPESQTGSGAPPPDRD